MRYAFYPGCSLESTGRDFLKSFKGGLFKLDDHLFHKSHVLPCHPDQIRKITLLQIGSTSIVPQDI